LAGIDQAVYAHVEALPDHRRVLEAVLAFFRHDPPALGAWVSGSIARGDADEYSDLDIGICFRDEGARTAAWTQRWDWPIAPWFHRFDADHVRPYFVIYLFEPKELDGTPVKADIALYLADELPPPEGGPYLVAWDDAGRLGEWAVRTADREADWELAVHEDERFWAWTYYCLQHVRRGEYYEIASEFQWLRGIVEAWRARLAGQPEFSRRRAESQYDVADLAATFPAPNRKALKAALLKLIELHERQRAAIDAEWKTTDDARDRIRAMVEAL
jgi:predicted nucleotidyltransferase